MKKNLLKNYILVTLIAILGVSSVAFAAPGDVQEAPYNPGNSSQPLDHLKIGSNLPSADLDVAGSNALSYFDKIDSFITVMGHLLIGGTTWIGPANNFSVPSNDQDNPGLIPLLTRTLNIAGTFLSSSLAHNGSVAALRPVCAQNSRLILCDSPVVVPPVETYSWDVGAWGECQPQTSPGRCTPAFGTFQTAQCRSKTTEQDCNSVFGTPPNDPYQAICDWTPGGTPSSIRSRTVTCKNQAGAPVADSFCVQPKPATSEFCTGSGGTGGNCTGPVCTGSNTGQGNYCQSTDIFTICLLSNQCNFVSGTCPVGAQGCATVAVCGASVTHVACYTNLPGNPNASPIGACW